MKEPMRKSACAVFLLLAASLAQSASAASCALNVAPRTVDYPWMSIERWRGMHAEQVARAKQGNVDVIFVGDSLTEMWPKALWESSFGRFNPANFGIGGDHTGNVLWRLKDPAIASLKPKLVVLMIGVNNINLCNEKAGQVFGGIQAVVAKLRKQYPAARILLNSVLPEAGPDSGERKQIAALNAKIRTLDDGKAVFVHDYGSLFTGPGGELSKELQPDLLHFSEKGYQLLAGAMVPDIERLLASADPAYTVTSPDGRNRIDLAVRDGKLAYTVTRDGAVVIAQSPLGLATNAGALDGNSLRLAGVEQRAVNDTYRPVAGKAASVQDHYNEAELALTGKDKPLQLRLVARAYDDGIAFRYVLPKQEQEKKLGIFGEMTGFHFPSDYQCWGFNPGRNENSHEGEFDPVKASAIRPAHLFDAPLVCKTGRKSTTFAIAEADKRDYAGAYYAGRGEGGLGVQVSLSWGKGEGDESPWQRPAVNANLAEAPLATPWRVVMLADSPGGLTASSLIATLGAPSKIADTSWIKPGKAAWDWWNGWAAGVPNAGVNTATYRAYIDFAASMGLEYILIDEGWYEGSSETPAPANVLRPIAAMDMPGIISYAREKGVGVWVWLQWKQLDRQMDDALRLYSSWGIKGIKVDFMDRNDQEMVGFYHKLLEKAAANRLMVNLHGAYPPDGLLRTYPNYMTQEGVLGAEYNKWSKRITATHNVTLPFTRMLLGPMDYTPGGFRSLASSEFPKQIRSAKPFVQTTRGQAVAMYVVYDSPVAMVADSPDAYRNADGSWADGASFIGKVPTSWDETRVLEGDIGQYIVTARRKGRTWYIGAMGNEAPRVIDLPLSFIEPGVNYRAEILQDGKDANHLNSSEARVKRGSRVKLSLAASGGAVAVLSPLP
ncbi:glycoside hydrolase family 97 catalytic domain-containing protein [Massilia endophytica]|uniref:glycoside hydrolase family 97 catalytic domain-containing protein n=1 Tax=Massilia endophytica TaxID=2899220 RepID=UPI001E5121F1|nr:glycoside hydrolase family 97 catalytic domain-containing protein [Massilia endophytica]UGQ44563.1 glycoside hydrolase family 97 catalytic domain-containing protein [Massilia endophytica]